MYTPNCVWVISVKRNAKREFSFIPIYITKYLVNVHPWKLGSWKSKATWRGIKRRYGHPKLKSLHCPLWSPQTQKLALPTVVTPNPKACTAHYGHPKPKSLHCPLWSPQTRKPTLPTRVNPNSKACTAHYGNPKPKSLHCPLWSLQTQKFTLPTMVTLNSKAYTVH